MSNTKDKPGPSNIWDQYDPDMARRVFLKALELIDANRPPIAGTIAADLDLQGQVHAVRVAAQHIRMIGGLINSPVPANTAIDDQGRVASGGAGG